MLRPWPWLSFPAVQEGGLCLAICGDVQMARDEIALASDPETKGISPVTGTARQARIAALNSEPCKLTSLFTIRLE